jgi:hypothetical protein
MCGSSFLRIWLWGGCSKIVKRSEVMLMANDSIAGYERGVQNRTQSHLSRKSTVPFDPGRVLFCREGSDYPFFERRKQGWQKEPVLSPSLGFVGQGVHTESGDRSQLSRSHWQQLPFNAPGFLA